MYVCHEMNAVKREFLKADQDLIGVHLHLGLRALLSKCPLGDALRATEPRIARR